MKTGKVTDKGEPILKGWKAKESGRQHEDKGETSGEEDHTGGAHHLNCRWDKCTLKKLRWSHHVVKEYLSSEKRSFMCRSKKIDDRPDQQEHLRGKNLIVGIQIKRKPLRHHEAGFSMCRMCGADNRCSRIPWSLIRPTLNLSCWNHFLG